MNFFAENLKVFKKAFLPLFVLVLISGAVEQYLNMEMEGALRSPLGMQQEVYIFGFLSIVTSILFPVLLLTIAVWALSTWNDLQASLSDFLKKYLNQMYIETLRSWGQSLLWSLILILPGVWKFLQFTMVPFVVTSSRVYDEGKIDALEASSKIFKKHWLKIIGIFVLFHLFIPILFSAFFDSYRSIWETPVPSLILSLIDTYFLLLSTQLLFNIFRSEVRRHDAYV